MNNYYQQGSGAYQVYNQSYNSGYVQSAVKIGITGAAAGAVAGAAKELCSSSSAATGRKTAVAKSAAYDAVICGTSSFAGAVVAGAIGTRGLLSFAVFAAAGVGTGYVLHKTLSKKLCSDSKGSTVSE